MKKIDPVWFNQWKKEIIEKIRDYKETGNVIEYTLRLKETASWLIFQLSSSNIPFKVINLSAGVRKITTDIESCPLCKQKLKGKGA